MAHVIETASTGRSKCRGCGEKIAAGELRFGERAPNPFGEGESTQWFHPECGSLKRPEPFLEALQAREEPIEDAQRLEAAARDAAAHPRLARIDGAERAPTARALCRACKEAIPKDAWRIRLVYFEEGRFMPSGFLHVRCAPAYFGTRDVLPRVKRFARDLEAAQLGEIERELAEAPEPTAEERAQAATE